MWRAQVLTLFPDMFPGPLAYSLAGKALKTGIWGIETLDIRRWSIDKHGSVDDTPAGGGPGMVMRADVVGPALDFASSQAADCPLIYLSPRGDRLDQGAVAALASGPGISLLCGRFEGVDERVLEARAVRQVSLGDFVLSGGEPAAFALLDACIRLLPGVIGAPETLEEESFTGGLLEYPHYTRPNVWEGRKIPEILTSGDHAKVRAWRQAQAEQITRQRRPDLWQRYCAGSQAMSPSSQAPTGAPKEERQK
ncbi:MAG: tRNA (guanosine(37)-N1)-methyltransferase TrmD [Pseudomonadota bacterium]